jgi:ATP-dependent DNA helicase DinG
VVERDAWIGELELAWHRTDSALEALAAASESTAGRVLSGRATLANAGELADRLDAVTRRASELRDELSRIASGGRGYVGWAELDPRRPAIGASPVDLSGLMRSRIFETVPAVVLTSATLTSARPGARQGASFEYVRARLGVGDDELAIDELTVKSPFDYEERALLYMPRDLPPPTAPDFLTRVSDRVLELVEISDGGAFVLTTSNRSLHALDQILRRRLPGRLVLAQGQAPKHALISAFRAAGDAVLVATMSFWEGVDVPGRSLRLVVLEKIPFAVPSEPIVRARSAALEQEGRNPFMELHLPAAGILLKQGFGRLIRTRSDRGVVALLDSRIRERRYGEKLISSLPPARRTSELDDVRAFSALAAR